MIEAATAAAGIVLRRSRYIQGVTWKLPVGLRSVWVLHRCNFPADERKVPSSLSWRTHVCPSRLASVLLPSSGGNWRESSASLAFRSAGCGEFDENVTLKMHVPRTFSGLCLHPWETPLAYDK